MALVNFEAVAAAAEQISKAGGKPSVRSVIVELGGGSPNAVLPLLNEWKAGRPALRSADIELDPRLAQVVADMIQHASEQAAKTAEERAADVQADAETVAEAAREAESMVKDLASKLDDAQKLIATKERALEDVQAAAGIETRNFQERVDTLQSQLTDERSRADQAVQAVAKAEVKLELIPGLQAEIERLKPFESQAAVLTANLEASRATAEDLKTRLAESLAEARSAHDDLERVRISEQSLQAKLDAAVREIESLKNLQAETKADLTTTKAELKEVREDLKKSVARAQQAHPKASDK